MRIFSRLLSLIASVMILALLPVSCGPQNPDSQLQNQSDDQTGPEDQPGGPEGPGEGSGPQEPPGPGGEQDEDVPVSIENATAKEVGKYLVSDQKIYSSTAFAKASGLKVCGVVAYVGNDTGEENYRHGLVISMKNFNGSGNCWNNTTHKKHNPNQYNILSEALDAKESGYTLSHLDNRNSNSYTWPAFYYACLNNTGGDDKITIIAPSNTSGWFLPSIFQWNQIVNGLTGTTAKLTTMQNASLSMLEANTTLEELGAQPLRDGAYWSSSEHSDNNAWLYWANYGKASDSDKNWNYYFRSVLAF